MPAGKDTRASLASKGRGESSTLTEEQIVDAALRVIRTEGLDALSMRRLSRELGRSAMAAYWYVQDKHQLVNLVATKMLSEVKLPQANSGTWEERLRNVVGAIDAMLHNQPSIAEVLLRRMLSTDRRLVNGVFDILVSAGFEGSEVFLSYAMIHTYLFGRYQVVLQADELPDQSSRPEDLEDTFARLMPYLDQLQGRDFFTYGIETIIAGLQSRLRAKPIG